MKNILVFVTTVIPNTFIFDLSKRGKRIYSHLKINIMANYEFIKSSYDVAQNGTFETFSVKFNGKDLFYWSDNNGLVAFKTKECIEDVYTSVYPIYLAMEAADIAAQKEWDRANEGIEDNYITVYSREGRTDEFGVNWVEL